MSSITTKNIHPMWFLCCILMFGLLTPGNANRLVEEVSKLRDEVAPPPRDVVVTFPSVECGDKALVEWKQPIDFYLVQKYYVKCKSLKDRIVEIVDGSMTQTLIGPLQLDSKYQCEVAAKVDFAISEPAVSVPFITV